MTFAQQQLDRACRKIPVINSVIRRYGDISLRDYLEKLRVRAEMSFPCAADFYTVVQEKAASLWGKSAAGKIVQDLRHCPFILTSNHLGVEYFAQSFQSMLMLSLPSFADPSGSAGSVPVFSFGNIPLNNLTYPRGLLIYHTEDIKHMPVRLPLFPNRYKRCIAGRGKPFDLPMIQRAQKMLGKMLHQKMIPPKTVGAVKEILQKNYCAEAVLMQSSYSRQSSLVNRAMWKEFFADPLKVPELAYFEIENIAGRLLEYDLKNPQSLAYNVMFAPKLRENVLGELEGIKGCWKRKELLHRMSAPLSNQGHPKQSGTVFFWGTDKKGRRIPLFPEDDGKYQNLRGKDDQGRIRTFPYSPLSLLEGIRTKRLLPSLFTCFLLLSFARGIACIGGYFQAAYLPAMQQGLLRAIKKTGGYHDVIPLLSKVPTDLYLSGMLAGMSRRGNSGLIPAGPAEIIAGGKIRPPHINKMLSLTVRDAHIAGLFETLPDILSPEEFPADWKQTLASDCFCLLAEKTAVI